MGTIDNLRKRIGQARVEAERERPGLEEGIAVGEASVEGLAAGIQDASEHRLLTTEEAVARAVGGATGPARDEIAAAQRECIRTLDAFARENMAGAA